MRTEQWTVRATRILTEPFDGRLSLLGAMACLPLLGYLVIVLSAAFATS